MESMNLFDNFAQNIKFVNLHTQDHVNVGLDYKSYENIDMRDTKYCNCGTAIHFNT